ncbi:MAG: hypothetical protein M5R36_10730 [Deltaproteobacteria bacterium]|nr:hypothetical protein [Deltaproteobacteria bacterium]
MQNIVIVASNAAPKEADELLGEAAARVASLIRGPYHPRTDEAVHGTVLTDRKNPVEYFIARSLGQP